ncbi:hypothetical protein [Paenibacillus sp. yr247]|uniref:hypothetical protein n=1 Tax=Paenibacillus sp. yr247 TaxID=1761880 RepID=UPI001C315085|nr:hypothetical protein [Paenibacillus sp. yr247]
MVAMAFFVPIIFMTAETNISRGKEIRVVGIFNHFFVIKNSPNKYADNREVPLN